MVLEQELGWADTVQKDFDDWNDMYDNSFEFMSDWFATPIKWMVEKAIDAGTKYAGDKFIGSYFREGRIKLLRQKINQTDWTIHTISLVVAISAEYYIEGKKQFSFIRTLLYYAGLYGFAITATQMIAYGKALEEIEKLLLDKPQIPQMGPGQK